MTSLLRSLARRHFPVSSHSIFRPLLSSSLLSSSASFSSSLSCSSLSSYSSSLIHRSYSAAAIITPAPLNKTPPPPPPSPSPSPSSLSGIRTIKVMSYFVAPRLDTSFLLNLSAKTILSFSKPDCVMISLENFMTPSPSSPTSSSSSSSHEDAKSDFSIDTPLAAVFQFGSVVFFNASEFAQNSFLKKIASQTGKEPRAQSKDDYKILLDGELLNSYQKSGSSGVRSSSSSPPPLCKFLSDSVLMRSFDLKAVRVIGQVLAQTVALEYYEQKVEAMMDQFRALNQGLEKNGKLESSSARQVFQVIAMSNTIIADLLTQLRLLDRSEIAWRYGEYDPLWHGLREEFEVEERFESLDSKVELIRDNNQFFSDVIHGDHSSKLEWTIIILITIEIILSLRSIWEEGIQLEKHERQQEKVDEEWKNFRTEILHTLKQTAAVTAK